MISAVCGRALPAVQLPAPQAFLLPPAQEPPRISHDWLSVTNTRVLPSTRTVATGAAVASGEARGPLEEPGTASDCDGTGEVGADPASRAAMPLMTSSETPALIMVSGRGRPKIEIEALRRRD